MGWFSKKTETKTYDHNTQKPLIRASICNGEQVAGFMNLETGRFEEVMLIRNHADLVEFKSIYGIEGNIEKTY